MTHRDRDPPEYTVKECRDRIEELDQQIKVALDGPESFSHGPISATSRSVEELRKERRRWRRRLKRAKAYRDSHDRRRDARSPLQGPDKVIE